MNPLAPAAALLLLAAPLHAMQDPAAPPPPPPPGPKSPPVVSTVEFSYIVPLDNDVLDPIGLARFQLSLESLLHGTLDDAVRGAAPAVKGIFFVGVIYLDRTIAKVGHEYGHIAVFNRAGYHDFLLTVEDHSPQPLTFREVFLNALVPQRQMSVQLEEDEALDALARYSAEDYEQFTMAAFAGGLNQEQIHLNLYRERVLRHQFGFFDTSLYLVESVSTLLYSVGERADIDGYVDSLERSGLTTSVGMVKALSLVRFFSGSAVSAGIGFARVMSEDRFDGFAPRVIAGSKDWTVLWPEFESFMTRRGPSVRTSLPVRSGGFLLLPGLESAIAEERLEFEFGLEASRPVAPWLDARAGLFAGTEGGYWGEVGVSVKPDPAVAILLSWHVADGYSFRRDVYGETFDFEEDVETGFQFGMSATFKF